MINEKLQDKTFFELVAHYYENHIAEDTCIKFNLTRKQLYKLLKNFNYKKPKEKYIRTKSPTHESYVERGLKSAATQRETWSKKTTEEKLEWAAHCKDAQLNLSEEKKIEKTRKTRETFSLKSQEEIDSINKKRSDSLKAFWGSLSSDDKERHIDNQLEKTKESCLSLYGVPFPCMLESARMHGNDSAPNRNFANLLSSNGIVYEREFRIGTLQYDFKVGDVLIEVNPTITHNSTYSPFGREPLPPQYHRNKMIVARENGYRLLCIWDWDPIDKIIFLLKPHTQLYGRKCIVKEVDRNTCSTFIDDFHLQGYTNDKIRLGLYYGSTLVSVMTFGKPRYNRNVEYELIRYCSNAYVIGGAKKLFSYFVKNYNPKSIISYCDNSKFDGHTYVDLGFSYKGYSIGKHWYNMNTHTHILDSSLRAVGFDRLLGKTYGYFGKDTSNKELMLQHGFIEVYDCGQSTYIWEY